MKFILLLLLKFINEMTASLMFQLPTQSNVAKFTCVRQCTQNKDDLFFKIIQHLVIIA